MKESSKDDSKILAWITERIKSSMTKIGETLCNKYPRSQAKETSSGERKGQKCQMLLMCEDRD